MPKATTGKTAKKVTTASEAVFRKTKIALAPGQAPVEGVVIPIKTSTERWSEYKLADGTVLRLKQAVTEIVRLEGRYDADGKPVYITKAAPVASATSVPANLIRKD